MTGARFRSSTSQELVRSQTTTLTADGPSEILRLGLSDLSALKVREGETPTAVAGE